MELSLWPREEAIEEALARVLGPGQGRAVRARDRTLDAFLDELARAAGARPLSPLAARLALRAACADGCAGTGFARVAGTRGFVNGAARFVAACERAGLAPAEVERAARDVGGASGERLVALAAVYARHARACEAAGASAARRQAVATRTLRGGGALPAGALRQVVVKPRLDWEPAVVDAVLALATRAAAVRVELPYAAGKPALTVGLDPVVAAFEAHPELEALELQLEDPAERATGARRRLLEALYRPAAVAAPPAEGEAAPVTVLAAPDPRAELRAVAAHVRRLVDDGTPPEAIAVAARTPAAVGRRLADELARVGLALEDRRGPPLAAAPPARLALALLALAPRRWPREEVLAVAASRYVGGGGDYVAPHALARAARTLGLRELAPAGAGIARLRRAGREREAARLEALLAPIAALPAQGTIAAHAAGLAAALAALEVGTRARALDPALAEDGAAAALQGRVERALARDQAAMDALDELLGGLGRAAALVGLGEATASREGFAALLTDLMAELPLRGIGARGGAVRLVALADLAGRTFAHVVVPGLVEGAAPARAADDGVFGDAERRALNRALGRAALAVCPGDEATPVETLMLYGALAAAEESVLLTWSRSDGDRPLLRSPFLDELLRAAPWTPVVVAPVGPVPGFAAARAPADLLARVALESFADEAGRIPAEPPDAGAAARYEAARRAMPERMARLAALAGIERARWRFFTEKGGPAEHAGGVGPQPAVAARLGGSEAAPLAAGHLDRFANCPFTVLAGKVLGVEAPEEGEDAPAARDLGRLAHRCLERFYRGRAEAGALPLRGGEDETRELAAVCAEVFAEAEAEAPPGDATLWELAKERLAGDLRRVVAREAEAGPPGGGVPKHFELEFGSGRDGALPALRIGAGEDALHVGGRIDRVDVRPDGGLVVLDYKLGAREPQRQKLRPDAAGRTALQLPLYVATARAALGGSADGAFISLKDAAPTPLLGEMLGGGEELARLLDEELPARLGDIAARLRAGRFEVRPEDCAYCRYRTVCRVVALHGAPEEP